MIGVPPSEVKSHSTVIELRVDYTFEGAAVTVGNPASTNVFLIENGPYPFRVDALTLY